MSTLADLEVPAIIRDSLRAAEIRSVSSAGEEEDFVNTSVLEEVVLPLGIAAADNGQSSSSQTSKKQRDTLVQSKQG